MNHFKYKTTEISKTLLKAFFLKTISNNCTFSKKYQCLNSINHNLFFLQKKKFILACLVDRLSLNFCASPVQKSNTGMLSSSVTTSVMIWVKICGRQPLKNLK